MKPKIRALPKTYQSFYIIALLILSSYSLCFSQTVSSKDDLLKITASSNSLNKTKPSEKLYLQFDKPYYAIGDTIWFKAYLFNPAYFTASAQSGVLYIDIANDSNKVVKQYKLPVASGLSWGNISLDEKEFNTGTYTIRAYTNWMRNFGDDCFFYKSIYISSTNENNLLINTRFSTASVNGANVLSAKLLFSDIDKIPFAVKPLQLQIMDGNKHLYKQKLQTGVDGILDINFNIPEKPNNLVIVAENEQKDKKAIIPITLNRPENTDIQFLPEGGNLVAGLPAHIGFKAIGEDGKGVDISGIITDHNQQQAAQFKSLHNGIGSFDIAVQEGETYTAKVTLPGGMVKEYPLPAIKNAGLVLKIKNPMVSDSLTVSVAATADIVQSGNSYFLIGKARGIVCYAAIFNFHEGNSIQRKIAKRLFPNGITHFTIMTTNRQPINERLVYIDHHDNLDIQFTTNKPTYISRDSIALKIKVTDNTGKSVEGKFSLAVTDDAQVKTDTAGNENILTDLLLKTDLKGYIENPGYYLNSKTVEAWQALDNLLLTQGWIGYDWGQVFNPPPITFQPEHDFVVKGTVVNVLSKPVKETDILLFSKTPSMLIDTTTDKNGKFTFDHFPRVDTPIFVLKAVNKKGKSFNVRINVDEIKPPDFVRPFSRLAKPWYVNSDTTLLNYTKNNAFLQEQDYLPGGGHRLKEVKITAQRKVPGSQNIFGPPDIVLDEQYLEKAGKKTWLQLLDENVKNFHESIRTIFSNNGTENTMIHWYFINERYVIVSVDGIFISRVIQPFGFLDFKEYLESHNAEDIKGIEVMYKWPGPIAYVEITTRSGHGPIIDNTPGMYLYKPLPISWPKQFYKPKYTVKDTAKQLPDLRSTIDWEPNITTSINGTARVSFYVADKPSTYTLIMEGTDMKGNLGYKSGKILVGSK